MLMHPWRDELFHYGPADSDYFEGWYFRLTDAAGGNALALIPGVSAAAGDPHAFAMVLDGASGRSARRRWPFAAFRAAAAPFGLELAGSRFGLDGLDLDLDGDIPVRGALAFSGRRPWRGTPLNPRAMGWFGYLPFLQCYHGVLSFSHRLAGRLTVAGRAIDYTGGVGYMEKDWGSAFPSAWIWAQSAHFGAGGASAMLSVAAVPFPGGSFRGFIFGLDCPAGFFRLATYTGARIAAFAAGADGAELTLAGGGLEAVVTVGRGADRPDALFFPADKGAMTGQLTESLDAEFRVRLSRRRGAGRYTVWEGIGRKAGLELAGDLAALAALGSGR
jgi:hypothetical protein